MSKTRPLDELHSLLFSEEDARKLHPDAANQEAASLWFNSVNLMQKHAWLGRMSSAAMRGICWRVCFGLFDGGKSSTSICPTPSATLYDEWAQSIVLKQIEYEALLKKNLPDAASIDEDPLSSFSQSDSQSAEWAAFYKKVDLANFIKVDLDRLYLQGLDEDETPKPALKDGEEEPSFFFIQPIPERLLNILMLFSILHDKVSYRQGMHEICGIVYYVLHVEARLWAAQSGSHPLQTALTDQYLESQTYFLFSAIMEGLLPLYDPAPRNKGPDACPAIIDFCTRIQEHFLMQVDPELCDHLQSCYIQSQIYGMRWSRLMLSREFPITDDFSLKIWDYLFATCLDIHPPAHALLHSVTKGTENTTNNLIAKQSHGNSMSRVDIPDSPATPDPLSVFSSSPSKGRAMASELILSELPSAQASMSSATKALRERYGDYSALMGVLGDFMLAMLLNIREELMQGDSNDVLGLLMRYPKVPSLTPIMDLADMLRRGVLFSEAHINAPQRKQPIISTPTRKYANAGLGSKPSSEQAKPNNSNSLTPSWLLSSPLIPAINTTAMNMSKRVSDNFSAAVSYASRKVGNTNDSFGASPQGVEASYSPSPSPAKTSSNNDSISSNSNINPAPNTKFDPLLGIEVDSASVIEKDLSNSGTFLGSRRLNNIFSSSASKEKTRESNVGTSSIKETNTSDSGASNIKLVSHRLVAIADALGCSDGSRDGELSTRLRYLSTILLNKASIKDYDTQFGADSLLLLNPNLNSSSSLLTASSTDFTNSSSSAHTSSDTDSELKNNGNNFNL